VVTITIRPAELSDDEALAEIEREAWGPHVSPSEYDPAPFFESTRPEEVLVALLDEQVAGFVCLRPASPLPSNAHVLVVDNVGVAPSAQRRGVASRLLEAVDAYATEHGIERLKLRVLSANRAALALYERHGYEIEGRLRGEFRLAVGTDGAVVPVDDVLMAKTLASAGRPADRT
jgi:ribosomal protein S18 acetylase RimI-like enzyme